MSVTNLVKALASTGAKAPFAPRVKGSSLGNVVPSVDPALKALAYNKRRKPKLS